jgi:RimJ/RimL family protein N-acetyltransferase
MRYFVPLVMSAKRIEHELARLFDDSHVTYVGRLAGKTDIVVVVELGRLAEGAAEIALTVEDTYQRQGIGRQVFALLPELLAQDDITRIEATALAENTAIRKLFAVFRDYSTSRSGDTVSYRAALAGNPAAQGSCYRHLKRGVL